MIINQRGDVMYQIGQFSKMNRITTKTLRHYDELGLLKPVYVDDFTGYRFYTSEQLPRLHRILGLKQMGLSLAQISILIDDPSAITIYLELREKDLEDRLQEEKKQLTQIKNYQRRLRGEYTMEYEPIIKSLPEVIVASMRFIAPNYDYYFDIIPKMGDEMRRQGAVCSLPEYCFNIYHDMEYKEKDIDVEVCEAVVDYCEDSDIVHYKVIKGVDKALCLLHKGPYSVLPEAYAFAMNWIKANDYELIGEPRESYIDGIWNKEDDSDWLTEIQFPIK